MGHKGYYGQYTGNAKWSKNHADTKVTKSNYKASERDDAAHIDYLKRDINYDNKHGHSDSSMTSDEKHISKLAGDMKYDKEHHGSPAKHQGDGGHKKAFSYGDGKDNKRKKAHMKNVAHNRDGSHSNNIQANAAPKMVSPAKHNSVQHEWMEPNMDEKRARHFEIYGKHGDTKPKPPKPEPPAKMVSPLNDKSGKGSQADHRMTNGAFARHKAVHDRYKDTKARIEEKE